MKDEEENEDEGVSTARLYSILEGLRASPEQELKKEIEETEAENEKLRSSLLTGINSFLLDIAVSQKWWTKLQKSLESMVINPNTQTIILLLTRDEEDENVWTVEAIVSPIKGKGKKYIEVDFGNDKSKKD